MVAASAKDPRAAHLSLYHCVGVLNLVTKIIKRHMERVTYGFRGLQSVMRKR